jgi:hypothetical protein
MSARGVTGAGTTLSMGGGGVEGLGGARPEDKIGSDDPVKREAAVAAAATLRSVPKTSILLDEIDGV